jgi:Holliday junction resolvase RusA-like endonuclease
MISIILPIPPTTNKMVKRTDYKNWSAEAKREVTAQREGGMIAGPFRIAILMPEGLYDADNLIKPLLDACQAGGAIVNDKLCRGGSWDIDDTRQGTVLIELTLIPPMPRASIG